MNQPVDAAPAKSIADRSREMVETYGGVFVAVTLTTFAVEMALLMTALKLGFDPEPFALWVESTLGFQVGGILEAAGIFWIAYGITRVFKPFTFAFTLFATPIVARAWNARTGGGPSS